MTAIAKRNIYLYFRDKTAVFFSLLAVFILIALYVFFLGDMTSKGLPDFPAKKALLTAWFIAGILTVTSVTSTLGALGVLVDDRFLKIDMDFNSSPISKPTIVGGYLTSAIFIGVVMTSFTFIVATGYLLVSGGTLLSFGNLLQMFGVIFLSVITSGAMVFFLVFSLKTSNAFASASMVIGTFIGFLAGIYIPIGVLPEYLQPIVKWFPFSHSASLFRQILMESPLIEAFADAPKGVQKDFSLNMGVSYDMNGRPTTKRFSVLYLIGTTLLFFSFSLLSMMKRKR